MASSNGLLQIRGHGGSEGVAETFEDGFHTLIEVLELSPAQWGAGIGRQVFGNQLQAVKIPTVSFRDLDDFFQIVVVGLGGSFGGGRGFSAYNLSVNHSITPDFITRCSCLVEDGGMSGSVKHGRTEGFTPIITPGYG